MNRLLGLFLLLVAPVVFAGNVYIAVLETLSDEASGLGRSEIRFLTDKLREEANAVLPAYMGYVIMTRENINAMIPPGKSLADCEGSCLAETGRNISADYVVQARVGKFGEQHTISVEMYDTKTNNLVGSFTAHKPSVDALLLEVDSKAQTMFKNIVKDSNFSATPSVEPTKEKKDNVFVDSRDGKEYEYKKIGSQVWMTKNMDFDMDGSFCYEKSSENCNTYGRLYRNDVVDFVCPEGWHLPTRDDFKILFDTAGGRSLAAMKLKSAKMAGTDAFGFNVRAGGYYKDDKPQQKGEVTYLWSSSVNGYRYAQIFQLSERKVKEDWFRSNVSAYVRCVHN